MIPPYSSTIISIFVIILSVSSQDDDERIFKISGEAAPEKAQEVIDYADQQIQLIDSSISLNGIPYPPPLSLNTFIESTESPPSTTVSSPRPPSSLPMNPPSTIPAPPSVRPTDNKKKTNTTTTTTLTPPPITTTTIEPNRTTFRVTTYDGLTITVEVDDEEDLVDMDDGIDIDKEFERVKADIEQNDKSVELKDIIKKYEINGTLDYYITSPGTTTPPPILSFQNDSIVEHIMDFNKLFDKKYKADKVIDNSTDIELESTTTTSTTKLSNDTKGQLLTTTSIPITTIQKSSSSQSTTITTDNPFIIKIDEKPKNHTKTCIHVDELKKIDNTVDPKNMKKGTIEVSVELNGEEDGYGERDGREESEEKNDRRHVRESKKVIWKKYVMNCDTEEDEKGKICKLWAASGLCSSHRPTMFLFCRKTCLCVGPY